MAAVFKFKADGSQYARGLNQMRGQTEKFSKGIKSSMRGGVAAGIAAVGAAVAKVINDLTELNRIIKKSGVEAESFQRLAYAAAQSGVSTERFADALKDLDVKLSDGIARGGSFAELITELGMDMEALEQMNPGERFLAFSDAIKEAGGSLSRFGADEFGDAMFEMLPVLELGSEGIKKLGKEANVVSQGQLESAERINRAFSSIIGNLTTKFKSLTMEVIRVFEAMGAVAGASMKEIGNNAMNMASVVSRAMRFDVSGAKEAFSEMIEEAQGATTRIGQAFDDVLDKHIVEDKSVADEKVTSLERSRRKAEIDAKKAAQKEAASEAEKNARSVAQSEATIAEEQEKRRQAALSDEEKIQDAIRKRIMLEEEYAAIDPFDDEVGKAAKGAELEKAKTKEQSLLREQEEDLKQFYEGLEILDGKDADEDKADPQTSIISSSLASIGGGGGTASFGNDPMLSESKKQSNLLEQLVSLQGGTTEGGGDLVTPEL